MKSLSRNTPRRGVKFWNPIMIAAFLGSLFLFSRAFLSSGPHNLHPAFLNLTKNHEASHFDSTPNLSTTKRPGALQKVSPPIWDPVYSFKNEASYMPPVFLKSDSLTEDTFQAVTPSLAPVRRINLLNWGINRSFSSRLLSNYRAKLRTGHPNQNDVVGKDIDDSDSEAGPWFDTGYDPLELEPFFSMEESGYSLGGQIFALKIWLDQKEYSRAKMGNVQICQASGGTKCWHDRYTHQEV